jgi:hypothetical protein
MVPSISRRHLVQGGCTAALVALAGCLGGDGDGTDGSPDDGGGNGSDDGGGNGTDDGGGNGTDDGGGNENGGDGNGEASVRPYPEYVATDDAGEATAIYADFVAIEAVSDEFDDLISDSEDPLLLLPARGTNLLLNSSLSLEGLGLGELLDSGETQLESEVQAVTLASQAFVAMGSLQTGEIETVLRSAAGQLGSFEQSAERGPYTFYQPAGDETTTVALSGTDILVADSAGPVERATAAATGSRTRAADAVDGFGWVLDAVDDPDVAFAGHASPSEDGTDNSTGALSGSSSFIATHTFDSDRVTAEVAAVYPSADALDGATGSLEATLGSEADDVSFEFDTDRVSVTGTYQAGADTGGE